MRIFTPEEVRQHIGDEMGLSRWLTVTQDDINAFADVTHDHQYIHVDPDRAAESKFGGTIAHGFYTLSLLTFFIRNGCGFDIEGSSMGVNRGFEKVQFMAPVKVGSRVRGRNRLIGVEEKRKGFLTITQQITVEIENERKPALVADWITMAIVEKKPVQSVNTVSSAEQGIREASTMVAQAS